MKRRWWTAHTDYHINTASNDVLLLASLQVGDLDLVEEPALELSVSGVVVPDAQERERAEAALRAHDEVHDAAGYQLLHAHTPTVSARM